MEAIATQQETDEKRVIDFLRGETLSSSEFFNGLKRDTSQPHINKRRVTDILRKYQEKGVTLQFGNTAKWKILPKFYD